MIELTRAILADLMVIRNQADIRHLKVENASLREEIEFLDARLRASEEAHENLTARVIAEVTG